MRFPLVLFLSLIMIQSFAQDTKTTAFISLFKEIEFKSKHVYSFARRPDDFPSTSTYPFKGILIDPSFHHLFKDAIDSEELGRSGFYATYRFFINGNMEALIVRESQIDGAEHHVYFLLYNHKEKKITSSLELSYEYGYEGSFGGMESWILDVDQDGQKDVVSRMWSESHFSTDDGGVEVVDQDSVTISLFDGRKFKEIGIGDTLLREEIKEDFPYYKEPHLSWDTEQGIFAYLEKEIDFEKPGRERDSWNIIAGSDKDLPSAKHELTRAFEIIGLGYKYGLDARLFEIYENNNRYYTAINFRTKAQATIALREIKKIFNKTAYIVNKKEWCPKSKYQKGGYLKCGN